MSFATAATKLVAIVEAITPTYKDRGLRSGFEHIPEATEFENPPTRGFALTIDGGTTMLPGNRGSCSRYVSDVTLTVFYPFQADFWETQKMIGSDYEDLESALRNETQWDRSTSTLVSIAIVGGDSYLDFTTTHGEDGSVLELTFPIVHKAA